MAHFVNDSQPYDDKEVDRDEQLQRDVAGTMETGRLTEYRKADEAISLVVEKVEEEIKDRIKLLAEGAIPPKLEIIGYRMNVVNGYMYYVKIRIPGNSFIHAKILAAPTGEITLRSVHETKTDQDEAEYFKLP